MVLLNHSSALSRCQRGMNCFNVPAANGVVLNQIRNRDSGAKTLL